GSGYATTAKRGASCHFCFIAPPAPCGPAPGKKTKLVSGFRAFECATLPDLCYRCLPHLPYPKESPSGDQCPALVRHLILRASYYLTYRTVIRSGNGYLQRQSHHISQMVCGYMRSHHSVLQYHRFREPPKS